MSNVHYYLLIIVNRKNVGIGSLCPLVFYLGPKIPAAKPLTVPMTCCTGISKYTVLVSRITITSPSVVPYALRMQIMLLLGITLRIPVPSHVK